MTRTNYDKHVRTQTHTHTHTYDPLLLLRTNKIKALSEFKYLN